MKMKKLYIVLAVAVVSALLLGSSFAFFNYTKSGVSNLLTAGDLYFELEEGNDTLLLENVFPTSSYKSRKNNDFLTFHLKGKNDSEDTIKYNVLLNNGEDVVDKERFATSDLRFDLIRVENGENIYVVRNKSFDELNDSVLYTRTLLKEDGEIDEEYKLHVWLSSDVIISDTETGDGVYSTEDFKNRYANVKVAASAEDNKSTNSLRKNYMNTLPAFVESNKENIKEIYFDTLTSDLSSSYDATNNSLKETISYQETGEVLFWLTDATLAEGEVAPKYVLHVASDGITYLTNGNGLFNSYSNVEKIEFNNVNTSLVTDMSLMFQNCSKLKSLDLSMFDTKKVTTMNSMFNNNSSLTNINLSGFDTSLVTNMSQMFMSCTSLESLDISNFATSKVTNLQKMFYGCENITELDLSNFDTTKVTNMSQLFLNCEELVNLNLDGWETSSVTTMDEMFSMAKKIEELDISTFDTASLTSFTNMFRGLNSIEKIYVSMSWDTRNVTVDGTDMMFENDSNLIGGNGTTYDSTMITSLYARIDNPTAEPGYFTYKEIL